MRYVFSSTNSIFCLVKNTSVYIFLPFISCGNFEGRASVEKNIEKTRFAWNATLVLKDKCGRIVRSKINPIHHRIHNHRDISTFTQRSILFFTPQHIITNEYLLCSGSAKEPFEERVLAENILLRVLVLQQQRQTIQQYLYYIVLTYHFCSGECTLIEECC